MWKCDVIYTYIHVCACIHTHIQACMYACIPPSIHSNMQTCIHAYHTHTHANYHYHYRTNPISPLWLVSHALVSIVIFMVFEVKPWSITSSCPILVSDSDPYYHLIFNFNIPLLSQFVQFTYPTTIVIIMISTNWCHPIISWFIGPLTRYIYICI